MRAKAITSTLPIERRSKASAAVPARARSPRHRLAVLWIALLATCAWVETQTSMLQSALLATTAHEATYVLAPGRAARPFASPDGPYDHRLGYDRIADFTSRLADQGFEVVAQASPTPTARTLARLGITPPYYEKARAGLRIVDAAGERIFDAPNPELAFSEFDEVPELLVRSLLFVENRDLLEPLPSVNPAVEWPRLARATLEWSTNWLVGGDRVPGGSTLATQLEKLRHSPEGRTVSSVEKLRQMASASLRAYQGGRDTREARKRIVTDYLNSIHLAAVPGHGEVIGLPMGLALWYGSDYHVVSNLMNATPTDELSLRAKAYAFRQALGLVLAAGRPYLFLVSDREALAQRTDRFLRALADEGVISARLRNAALQARPEFHLKRYESTTPSSDERDEARPIRTHLLNLLGVDGLYALDRLDLEVQTTTRSALTQEVQRTLDAVRDPDGPTVAALRRQGLLNDADPSALTLSFSLYERTGSVNRLRLHADTRRSYRVVDDSVMLDLGSTAKLRTLTTYLELMARLYSTTREAGAEIDHRDTLAQWAKERRERFPAESLDAFLNAAMDRRYSASPDERFFTGRGIHRFANFNEKDDDSRFSVRNATRHSINLVFIRLMRDIVDHLAFGIDPSRAGILTDPDHPLRAEYLTRASYTEGLELLGRYYRRYHGLSPERMREIFFERKKSTPQRAAALIRLMQPALDEQAFGAELRAWRDASARGHLDDDAIAELFSDSAPYRLSRADQVHLADTDWLHLWTLAYLSRDPSASFDRLLIDGRPEIEPAFEWLLRTRHKKAQDRRIFAELETDAFEWIHRQWRSHGYPFHKLVPSLATALGASADRPSALAELMGIIQADGMRLPTVRLETIRLAADTPYDTVVMPLVEAPTRVMSAQVARVLRKVLVDVAENGTARRSGGALPGPHGVILPVGGKTGTGDHVSKTVDGDGVVTASHAISRSAVFSYLIGDRYFGVVTVYVKGPESARYEFTSSLATEVFRSLRLTLMTLINEHATLEAPALPVRAL
jgi:membrane peptidoglycan carboxypeptidase